MFDEADKSENLSYVCNFINQLNKYKIIEREVIESLIFITATPLGKKFWNKLKKEGITELQNIKNSILEEFEPFDEIIDNYHKISDNYIKDQLMIIKILVEVVKMF